MQGFVNMQLADHHTFVGSSLVANPRHRARNSIYKPFAFHKTPPYSCLKAPPATGSDNSSAATQHPLSQPLQIPRPCPVPFEDVILFQAFGWDSCKENQKWYQRIQQVIPTLTALGVTHLWLPPPSTSVDEQGYLPTQLYDLNSKYGTAQDLIELNTALLKAGLRPICDVVINHRSADEKDRGLWNIYLDTVPHPGHSIAWGPEALVCCDGFGGRGGQDSGADFPPAPDLDHTNKDVQMGISDWLKWIQEYVGFEGLRLDFAKGYSDDIAQYYLKESLKRPGIDFCVGEYWADAAWTDGTLNYNQDAMRQAVCNWLDVVRQSAAFDFPTKALLQEAVKNQEYDRLKDKDNKPPGLMGWWPQRAVTFIDNHDTGSSQRHWPFIDDGVEQGYAYILTHPGIPCIFWEHYFEWDKGLGETIDALMAIRRQGGVQANSKIEILKAEKDCYVAKVNGTVICKLGPRFDIGDLVPRKEDGWALRGSGNGWAVWLRMTGQ